MKTYTMTYTMDDGTMVRPSAAREKYEESTSYDGRNHVSNATGDQWEHEMLYLGTKGRWYIFHSSSRQGGGDNYCAYVTPEEACAWLLRCGHSIPASLQPLVDSIVE
jgi:hypothetical protein